MAQGLRMLKRGLVGFLLIALLENVNSQPVGQSSTLLDAEIYDEDLLFWEGNTTESNRESEVFNEWVNEPYGSYKWCSSAASVELCDREWDNLCRDTFEGLDDESRHAAYRLHQVFGGLSHKPNTDFGVDPNSGRLFSEISAELDLMLETESPGFWANWSAAEQNRVPRNVSWESEPEGSYKWCNSLASATLSDRDWDERCANATSDLDVQPYTRALKVHYHVMATNNARDWVKVNHRLAKGKTLWMKSSNMGNIAASNLPGHGANNRSQSNQSFMFRSGGPSWDMLTTDIGWTDAPAAIHIHDISASTTLAVTGNLRSESMATGEQECGGWSNTGHWKFIWSTTSVNTARCSKWIDVNNMGMGTRRYLR